ncbi:MAG: radical SAM/SPASM family putative metalloenzyme maturase [Pseudomonadota bacterium]
MNTSHPKKIYVELTTRCNLHCRMCVKYAAGSCIVEEDLPFEVFKNLRPSLAHAKTLILNGIGEPLLHPDLWRIIRFARAHMPTGATIGFQSNGLLLDGEKCLDLISTGLSTICLSLDSLEDTSENSGEHSFTAVSQAVENLVAAKNRASAGHLRIGLEIVLTKQTIEELPKFIQWAVDHGTDYVIATNLLLYNRTTEGLSLFNPNTPEATQLFNSYNERAAALGTNLANGLSAYLKFIKTEADKAAVQLFKELQQEASNRDIRLHLQSLLEHTPGDALKVEQAFVKAQAIAARNGIELFLPSQQALSERTCPFIAEQAVFIAASGAVMPCHFLWHTYSCRVLGEEVQVQECDFGTIRKQLLDKIWQSSEYTQFRQEAGQYDYASCWSCSMGPCAPLVNDNILTANDCYGSQVPCGHCQWNLGGIHCL